MGDSARLEPSRPRRILPASWDRSAARAADGDAGADDADAEVDLLVGGPPAVASVRGPRVDVVPAATPGTVRGSFVADDPAARAFVGLRWADVPVRGSTEAVAPTPCPEARDAARDPVPNPPPGPGLTEAPGAREPLAGVWPLTDPAAGRSSAWGEGRPARGTFGRRAVMKLLVSAFACGRGGYLT